MDGTRHSDRNIRMACIKMLPIILVETEVREQASELIQQETDSEIRTFLAELMIDESLEGTEEEKNRFLAPAPKVERDEGSLSEMPEMPPAAPPEEEKKKPEKPAQPSQDELYYGEDFDEGTDDLI
jgi:outer membrane biosynthesis protein TonB